MSEPHALPTRAPEPEDAPPDLREYGRIVLKHKWTVALLTGATVAAVGVWTLRQPKIYEAVASVVVDINPPLLLPEVKEVVEIGAGNSWLTKEYFNTQKKIIESRALAVRVAERLGLASAGEKVVNSLRSKIRVEQAKDSRVIYISIRDTDPARAAQWANAVAETYIDHNLGHKIEGTRDAVDKLTDQLAALKKKLEASEAALYEYKRKNDILSTIEDKQNTTTQALAVFNETLTRTQVKRAELEARRKQVEELLASAGAGRSPAAGGGREANGPDNAALGLEGFPLVMQSPTVQNLKLRYLDERQAYTELAERYGEKHPTLIRAKERMDKARENLMAEIQAILKSVQAESEELRETERNLAALIEAKRREFLEVNKREGPYVKLLREVESNQRQYEMVLKRLKEADLSGGNRSNNIRMLDPAQAPTFAVSPNVRANLTFALLLGLLGGIGLAFLLEFLDNTVKTQEDVERTLGVPFLGIIPSILSEDEKSAADPRSRDLYIHTNPKSSVAECCRSIRTNLLFMSPDRPIKRILITSSGPQEGKTTTAIQLAIAMAQSGSRVLLLDTDMRRPRVHRSFGVSNERGLSTVILGEATLDDAIKTTEVPNLFVLPCGPVPPNPAELLHAERFQQIVRELDGRYDRVIYDSPPVGAVADGVILATLVDGVVMVIKSGRTSKEMAKAARRALGDVNARILGALLNDLDLENREYGYYYYYYYRQYGQYYGEKKDSAA